MKAILVFGFAFLILSPAWGNGDPVRYDPRTGVLLPAAPTAARVEREQLKIEFGAREKTNPPYVHYVKVQAKYWLHNPTDKPLDLQIGFPVPGGGVQLKEPPVRIDGQAGEWKLIEYQELIEPHLPRLRQVLFQWADRHPKAVSLAEELRGIGYPR